MDIKNAISQSKKGILLNLHVITGSSQSIFPSGYNKWRNSIEIKVKAEAKDNKANNEVKRVLSDYFNIDKNDIFIVSGEKSRNKVISLENVSLDTVFKKIKESFNEL